MGKLWVRQENERKGISAAVSSAGLSTEGTNLH